MIVLTLSSRRRTDGQKDGAVMRVTIKDIARIAGVSHPTVSRALNGEEGVGEETRARILEIARQLDYVPNLAAKRLARHKTNTIGLVWPQKKSLFYYHLNCQIQLDAQKAGYNVVMSMAEPAEALRVLNQQLVDMAIFWLPEEWILDADFLREKETFRGPVFILGGGRTDRCHIIDIDRQKGVRNAVLFLAERGHRNIGFVGSGDDKHIGFMQGILEAGLDYRPRNQIVDNFREYLLEEEWNHFVPRFEEMFSQKEPPTAVLAATQASVFYMIRYARYRGLDIPRDVSVAAYDDVPEILMVDLPLTTVGPSIPRISQTVLDLIQKMDDPQESQQWADISIMPEIVLRDTTPFIGVEGCLAGD